ncbi:MAG: phosphatidate cytidylyltransferase [Bacteroidota bacterium]|nr:phosphatidate cytidylyltransferase [Bacteroidota bacterium]
MNNFWKRTITGILIVAIIAGSIILTQYAFAIVALIIVILGIYEFFLLYHNVQAKPMIIPGILAGVYVYLSIALSTFGFIPFQGKIILLAINLTVFPFLFFFELFSGNKNPIANVAFTILPILYVSVPFGLLNLLYTGPSSLQFGFPTLLLGYFIIIWTNDTGAYLAGMAFGKHKLFERVSPKKTWEGLISGAVFAFLFAWLLSLIFTNHSLIDWFSVAAIVAVFGTMGDLVESLFKRNAQVKDSGSILPGHGGMLDRFDVVFLSAPFLILYFLLSTF